MEHATERLYLLAQLAAERAGLLESLLGLDEADLVEKQVFDDWTVKDILAHIAAWDRWELSTMRSIVAGEAPDFAAVQDLAAANTAFVAEWRDHSLKAVVNELTAARSDWVDWLCSLSSEEFFRPRSYFGHEWTFSKIPLQIQWAHDAEHAEHIRHWREREVLKGRAGPSLVLRAALDAARDELLTAAAMVPVDERSSRPVCGDWTVQDLLGHVADWENYAAKGLRQMTANQIPDPERLDDIESWNIAHAQARQGQTWEKVWDDLQDTRQAFLEALTGVRPTTMERTFPFAWGVEGTPYEWIRIFLGHDLEHAREIRHVLTDLS